MTVKSPYIFITLNVNRLNSLIKRQRVADWIKTSNRKTQKNGIHTIIPNYIQSLENLFHLKRNPQAPSEGKKEDIPGK